MEYLLTNFPIPDSKKTDSLFIQGKFTEENGKIYITEDRFFNPERNLSELFSPGILSYAYSQLIVTPKTHEIRIQNDEIGTFPVYYYCHNNKVLVSNNIWRIISSLPEKEIEIDPLIIKSFFVQDRIPHEEFTFFKNIMQLPAASQLILNYSTFKNSIKKYWSLVQDLSHAVNPDEATDELYNALSLYFDKLSQKELGKILGFGNSGGLDSRIIPAFAKEKGITLKGFIIGNEKPRNIFRSISHTNAHEIADNLGIEHYDISYKIQKIEERLLLDIRNNPLSNSQIFKNPFHAIPSIDYMICGGNGFIVSNDSNRWASFAPIKTKDEKISYLYRYLDKTRFSTFQEKVNKTLFKSTPEYKKNILEFEKEIKPFIIDCYADFYERNKQKDNLSFIRSFHQSIVNKHSPNGGFESISRTVPAYYLYFPYALSVSLKWPMEFFLNRKILSELLIRKFPKIAHIEDQKGKSLVKKQNETIRQTKLILKGSGLDYRDWYSKDNRLKKEVKSILLTKNPIFEEIIGEIEIEKLTLLHPNILLDIVKVKKILDIVYFKQFGFIDNVPEYYIR